MNPASALAPFDPDLLAGSLLFRAALQLLKHALLLSFATTFLGKHAPYAWFSLLTPFTYYEFLHSPHTTVHHILILALLAFTSRWTVGLSLSLLIILQPTYALLIIPIACSSMHAHHLNKILLIVAGFLTIFMGLNLGSLSQFWDYYLQMYCPTVYKPSFSLVWLLFSHMFQQYKALFSLVFFLIPFLLIPPLYVILRPTSNNQNGLLLPISASFCLIVIYYTSTLTTVFDIYLYYLLLIPGYRYYKNITGATVMLIGSVLFVVLALAVMDEWANSFTVTISYVFYMLMPFWILTIIFQVQVFNSLAY